jgi:hypothetical protein
MTSRKQSTQSSVRGWILGALAVVALGATGCQVDVAGQTLPSAWYFYDDVQYFQPGPEFKLQNEANAQRAYQQDFGATQ